LRTGRSRRQRTSGARADGLVRIRARRPILARPVGAVRRVWKWVRRNSALTAAGVPAAAATVALIVGLSVAYARVSAEVAARGKALDEKDRALQEKTRAEQDASREAQEKGKALEDKTRAEAKTAKGLTEALNRPNQLH